MKKTIFLLATLCLLASCHKPTLKQQYEAMTDELMVQYEAQTTREGKDSVIEAFVPTGFDFLMAHLGE